MASRRSGRKGKGGKGFMMGVAAVVLAGGGGGLWMAFGAEEKPDTTAAAINDLLPAQPGNGGESSSQAPAPAAGLAQVERLLAETSATLAAAEGEAREAALRDAYGKLAPLLENPLPVEERERALPLFHSVTSELFLSSVHNEFSENYVVKSGDSYDRIAAKAGVSTALLYDLNNRPRGHKALHPGENLKLPKGQPHVVVRKRDFTASLYFGQWLVRQYVVAHGKNNNTPEGASTISTMSVDPEKSSRGPNDQVNEMKLRWMGLSSYGGNRTGIGFHGTQHADSIPGMTSRGCIRMKDEDVVELYDMLRIGNKVEVKA
ncbi:MAG: L,D-transpeptidase family protein [Planctomycetes bacterium]|nr:L,D-transpeptidase family protein [Planctomycetota bacterium]